MSRLLGLAAALAFLNACGNADATPDASAAVPADGQALAQIVVYKTTTCTCCAGWAGVASDLSGNPWRGMMRWWRTGGATPGGR